MKKAILPILLLFTSCVEAQPSFTSTKSAHFATLPAQVNFAGERVPLEYADIAEALDREMVAVMSMHSTTLLMLSRTTRYFPVIEPILAQYGIPNDFKYLAMTESSLDPNAASSAGARGMWQFIPATAKEFGLANNADIDMRYDVEKSTHAACKYFKKAYARFGSWTMVAASYNLGMAGVSSRIEKQGVRDYYDLFLPDETMRYVFHIVACKIVTPNPEQYGFSMRPEDYHKPYTNTRIVTIDDTEIDWSAFATTNKTNYRVLRILNPWIRSYSLKNIKNEKYSVTLPTANFRKLGY